MKNKNFITLWVIIAVTAGLVLATSRGMKAEEGDFLFDRLNLTAEQKEKIRVLKESYLKDKEPIRNQLYSRRMELRLLWLQTKPDPDKIKAKQKEIHDLKWEQQIKRTDYHLAFRDILTPEQLAKYIALEHDSKQGKGKSKRGR